MLNMMNNKKGVALISTLFFLIIVTMLATGAIVLSTVQMKVASSITRWERGMFAAEGAVSYVVPLLQYAHFDNTVPNQYCGDMAGDSPCVPLPALNKMVEELQQTVESSDTADLNIPAGGASAFKYYDMAIDIDAIGTSMMAGGGVEASWAYHGSAYSSSMLKAYRVKATASTPGGSTRTSVCQVVWLRAIM